MTQRNKTLLIIFGSAALVLVIVAVVFLLLQSRQPATNTNTAQTNTNVNVVVITTNTATNLNTNTAVSNDLTITRVANLFVERFGSYSTDALYQNLIDLKPYMTEKMQQWVDTTVANGSKTPSTTFAAMTAKVLTTTITSQTATTAELMIGTRRTEDKGNTNGERTYTQDIIVKMVKTASDWKVDSALWQ